jgi:hypothetical protein
LRVVQEGPIARDRSPGLLLCGKVLAPHPNDISDTGKQFGMQIDKESRSEENRQRMFVESAYDEKPVCL